MELLLHRTTKRELLFYRAIKRELSKGAIRYRYCFTKPPKGGECRAASPSDLPGAEGRIPLAELAQICGAHGRPRVLNGELKVAHTNRRRC